jgi:hypothetical protein
MEGNEIFGDEKVGDHRKPAKPWGTYAPKKIMQPFSLELRVGKLPAALYKINRGQNEQQQCWGKMVPARVEIFVVEFDDIKIDQRAKSQIPSVVVEIKEGVFGEIARPKKDILQKDGRKPKHQKDDGEVELPCFFFAGQNKRQKNPRGGNHQEKRGPGIKRRFWHNKLGFVY